MHLKFCRYSAIIDIDYIEKDTRSMKTKTIGIFDSGIGGLSVLAYARRTMPDVDFIYYADTEHVPYGTKSQDEIAEYSFAAADFLVKNGAEAVLVACNTATSMAVDVLRDSFSCPIVGMEPAVKPAVTLHPHERILVCATPATIHGRKLHDLLQKNAEQDTVVDLVALPELVLYAEQGFFDPAVVAEYIKSRVERTDYTACVLGCTHFSYFRDSMRLALPDAELIDGTAGTVSRLVYVTDYRYGGGAGAVRYYQTGAEVVNPMTIDFYESLQHRALSVI